MFQKHLWDISRNPLIWSDELAGFLIGEGEADRAIAIEITEWNENRLIEHELMARVAMGLENGVEETIALHRDLKIDLIAFTSFLLLVDWSAVFHTGKTSVEIHDEMMFIFVEGGEISPGLEDFISRIDRGWRPPGSLPETDPPPPLLESS